MTVSLGFAIFYLVRDNEVISISSASIYKDVGQKFSIDIDHRNPKKSTTIEISTSDAAIVSYNDSNKEFRQRVVVLLESTSVHQIPSLEISGVML